MISSLGEMYYNSIDRASSLNQYDHVVLLVLSRSRTVSLNPRGAPTETRATRKVRVRDAQSASARSQECAYEIATDTQMEEGRKRAGRHPLTPRARNVAQPRLNRTELVALLPAQVGRYTLS